ncbi:hypothetical protein PanWU01x14_253520 [Parasponia andersonii]|uniref:Uncharacterized protein n=1 Tax=Parasponia andersonii TaxID=3476 RepID=A0A2P5BBR2_PARAD|nr:hypothetical protein PanWU01x14_253520 [Parasponia andersonii]
MELRTSIRENIEETSIREAKWSGKFEKLVKAIDDLKGEAIQRYQENLECRISHLVSKKPRTDGAED